MIFKRTHPQDVSGHAQLITLFISDLQSNSGSHHLQKYSDDSVECLRDGQEEYRALLDYSVERGGKNYFLLNVNQTREVVIDFRRKTRHHDSCLSWNRMLM